MHFGSTVWAVFGTPRTGDKASAADFASAHIFRIEDVFFQLQICREDCAAKVFADECVGDRLWTSAAFAVIQKEAIAVNIVAAKLDQSPDTASLFGCETEQLSV